MSKTELDASPILLTTGDSGRLQEVTQLDLDEPFKTLGIHKTVSDFQKAQVTEMKRKSGAYAGGILSVSVNHFEAWTGPSILRGLKFIEKCVRLGLQGEESAMG